VLLANKQNVHLPRIAQGLGIGNGAIVSTLADMAQLNSRKLVCNIVLKYPWNIVVVSWG
jgi:hypothetical protein